MDNLSLERQTRAIALEAASRIVAENLKSFVNFGSIPSNQTYTVMAVRGMAKEFEKYLRGSGQ